jgi:hypothetical protein
MILDIAIPQLVVGRRRSRDRRQIWFPVIVACEDAPVTAARS